MNKKTGLQKQAAKDRKVKREREKVLERDRQARERKQITFPLRTEKPS